MKKNTFLLSVILLVAGFILFEAFDLVSLLLAVGVAIITITYKKSIVFSAILFVILDIIIQPLANIANEAYASQPISLNFGALLNWMILESIIVGLIVLFFSYLFLGALTVSQVEKQVRKASH